MCYRQNMKLWTPAVWAIMVSAPLLPSPSLVSVTAAISSTEPACRPVFCQIAKVRCVQEDGTLHVCCRALPECPPADKQF